MILESRKIRFSSLNRVDDLNESEFSDANNINFSSHTLISCWTKSGEENLAFWKMYTPDMKGVRIKISKNIFNNYSFMTNDVMYAKEDSFIEKSLVTKSECFNENYWIIPLKDSFVEVVYTDDELLLRPIIYNKDENIVKFGEVGKYKSTIWEFQKEIRFKLVVLPTKDRDGIKLNPMNDFGRIMLEKIDPPFQNYNIEIRKEAYELMEITLGPKCNLAEEIIVESLIQKFNPKAKINRNKYKGLIR